MADHPSGDIVRLAEARNPAEAHIWRQALEEAGIRCKVVGDYLGGGMGDLPKASAEVWVHEDDLERAQSLLAAHRPGPEEDEEEP